VHTSSAICRVGRVPSREAFRGSVITCSRNNGRLILSSWLLPSCTPSLPQALVVATYRPFVLLLFQSSCEHESFDCPTFCSGVFTCLLLYIFRPLSRRTFVCRIERDDIDLFRIWLRAHFNRSEIRICRTGEAWEVSLPKHSVRECTQASLAPRTTNRY